MTRLQNEQEKEKFISPPVRGQPSPNEQYRLLSSCLSYVVGLSQWSQNNYEPGELLAKSGGRAIAPRHCALNGVLRGHFPGNQDVAVK